MPSVNRLAARLDRELCAIPVDFKCFAAELKDDSLGMYSPRSARLLAFYRRYLVTCRNAQMQYSKSYSLFDTRLRKK